MLLYIASKILSTSSARRISRDFTDFNRRVYIFETSTVQFEIVSTDLVHELKMPGRRKKRKSTVQSFETVPNPKKQILLTTKNLTTIRDKHPAWSAPIMRQQSITQMDVLRDYYHPDLENENPETDNEESDSYVALPTRNKRRKVSSETPLVRRIETRRAKRQATKEEPLIQEQKDQDILLSAVAEPKAKPVRAKVPTAMLPQRTPTSLRRKEIPSSQSPAETPLSTPSRRSFQDYTRSPLKQRSTNIGSYTTSPIKGARWSKRLEVADSMEIGEEDSPVATRVGLTTETVGPATDRGDIPEEEPPLPSYTFSIHVDDFNQRLKAAQRPVKDIQNSNQARPRHEVVDSTDDEEDDDEGAEAFNAGPETQAALTSTDVYEKSSDRPPESSPAIPKSAEGEPEGHPGQRNASESPDPLNAPSPLAIESNMKNQLTKQRSKKVEFFDLASSDAPDPTTPYKTPMHHSDLQEASAQLFADLRRDSQPGGLQTESQYENGWTLYTPADDVHSDLHLLPSSPQPVEQPSSGLMTVPTQLILPPISRPPKFYKAPVPPSQATTVDVTQLSPRNALPLSSQPVLTQPSPLNNNDHDNNKHPSLPPPRSSQAFPSSPPPMPPPSSSPLASRKLDPWAGYEWDGVRLTDSQLLPDSLLNDNEVGPPGFSQESWPEEV